MNLCKRLALPVLTLTLVVTMVLAEPSRVRELTEADVLKLVELEIEADRIADCILKHKLAFEVNDDLLARMKKAGASTLVLNALRKQGGLKVVEEASPRTMMVWTNRYYATSENPLESELLLNGESLGMFKSETQKPIDKYLKKGWNEFKLKTTPRQPANNDNSLTFSIGPVHKEPESGELVMDQVYWKWNNFEGWTYKDGKFTHDLGPGTKDVTLTFSLYFAGLDPEPKVRNGDYVLDSKTYYGTSTASTSVTIYVNGTVLNSFFQAPRELGITHLLQKGTNEIKVVSHRVHNRLDDNDTTLTIAGPAEYNIPSKKFLLGPVVSFKSDEGWKRDKKTGQLVNAKDPKAETVERVITFKLEEEPRPK